MAAAGRAVAQQQAQVSGSGRAQGGGDAPRLPAEPLSHPGLAPTSVRQRARFGARRGTVCSWGVGGVAALFLGFLPGRLRPLPWLPAQPVRRACRTGLPNGTHGWDGVLWGWGGEPGTEALSG